MSYFPRRAALAALALPVAVAAFQSARAADLPILRPTMMPPPQQTQPWNSCFVGGSVGLQVTNATVKPHAVPELEFPYYTTLKQAQINLTQSGPTIGINAGCDRAFGDLVVGIEGNLNYNPSTTKGLTGYSDPWLQEIHLSNHFGGSLAGRFGLSFGDTLVYAKLGVGAAAEKFQSRYTATTVTYAQTGTPGLYAPSNYVTSVEADHTRIVFGPLIGFGLEHMLSEHWSAKLEADTTWLPPTRGNFTFDAANTKFQAASGTPTWRIPDGGKWKYSSSGFISNIMVGMNYRM